MASNGVPPLKATQTWVSWQQSQPKITPSFGTWNTVPLMFQRITQGNTSSTELCDILPTGPSWLPFTADCIFTDGAVCDCVARVVTSMGMAQSTSCTYKKKNKCGTFFFKDNQKCEAKKLQLGNRLALGQRVKAGVWQLHFYFFSHSLICFPFAILTLLLQLLCHGTNVLREILVMCALISHIWSTPVWWRNVSKRGVDIYTSSVVSAQFSSH